MAWREMRLKKRQMTDEETKQFLLENNLGHLGTLNEDGTPYVIGINYAYVDGRMILHCAKSGHKLDNIHKNPRVCFTVTRCYGIPENDKSCSDWDV